MVSILLFDKNSFTCPPYWLNFVNHMEEKYRYQIDFNSVRGTDKITKAEEQYRFEKIIDIFNTELVKYNSIFWVDLDKNELTPNKRYLDFYDEKAYEQFMIIWSLK